MSDDSFATISPAAWQHGLWPACVDYLAQRIPDQQFNTWIRPLGAAVSTDPLQVTLQVANRFKLDWIRSQYVKKISAVLSQLAGQDVAVELALTPRVAVKLQSNLGQSFSQARAGNDVLAEALDVPTVRMPTDDAPEGLGHR